MMTTASSATVAVAAATAAAAAAIVVTLLPLVNMLAIGRTMSQRKYTSTYNGINFVFYCALRTLNGIAAAHKFNLTLALTRSWLLGDIDLASGTVLHFSNGLATLSNNHANSLIGHINRILDLVLGIFPRVLAALWRTIVAVAIPAIAVDNLHDQILGMCGGSVWANQIDGS